MMGNSRHCENFTKKREDTKRQDDTSTFAFKSPINMQE